MYRNLKFEQQRNFQKNSPEFRFLVGIKIERCWVNFPVFIDCDGGVFIQMITLQAQAETGNQSNCISGSLNSSGILQYV